MTSLSSCDLVDALLLIRAQRNHRESVRLQLRPSCVTLPVKP